MTPVLEATKLHKHFLVGGATFRRSRGVVKAVDGVDVEVAEAVAPVLGWDEARVGSEIARTMDQLAALHGWQASADANIPA